MCNISSIEHRSIYSKSRSVFQVHWCLQWNGSTEWWQPLGRKDRWYPARKQLVEGANMLTLKYWMSDRNTIPPHTSQVDHPHPTYSVADTDSTVQALSISTFLAHAWPLNLNSFRGPQGRGPGTYEYHQTEQANVCGCCSADFGMVRFLFSFNTIWYGIPHTTLCFWQKDAGEELLILQKKSTYIRTYAPMTAILTLWKCWYGICFPN